MTKNKYRMNNNSMHTNAPTKCPLTLLGDLIISAQHMIDLIVHLVSKCVRLKTFPQRKTKVASLDLSLAF